MPVELNHTEPHQVTQLIAQASDGDHQALNDLIPLVYDDLKRIASGIRHKQVVVSKTLNTTALVNEAWLKLKKWGIQAESRKHFFCVTAQAMRQVLINTAQKKMTQKRSARLVTFDDGAVDSKAEAEWILMLEQVLKPIEQEDSRMAQVFQLRYFLGMSEVEVAEIMDVSISTVSRDWLTAKKIISNILK